MVKRKTEPKIRAKASYAARTAEPVSDSTSSSNEQNENASNVSSSEENDSNHETVNRHQEKLSKQLAAKKTTILKQSSNNKVKVKSIAERSIKSKNKARVFKEIKLLQKTTNMLIPRAPFLRLIKDLITNRSASSQGMRVTEAAVEALREASESFLTSVFEDSYLLALHCKRVTLYPRDMSLLLHLRHDGMAVSN